MFRKIKTIGDVVDWGLCTGCGACFSACQHGGVQLVNLPEVGIRPKFIDPMCETCVECLAVCPGYEVDGTAATGPTPNPTQAEIEFGKALEIWEGYATDPELRYAGSSGGVLSALSLYCLQLEGFDFVLHTAAQENKPWANETVKSRTREDLLSRTGSRYAPASPCDGVGEIAESKKLCVFIGKPCDTAAVCAMKSRQPELDKHLGLVLTFFCAGTPSEKGTLDLVAKMGMNQETTRQLRYRGAGWPGKFEVVSKTGKKEALTYSESWGHLTRYRPQRCHLCPDGLGRVADIACGDAWDKFEENGDPGRSLILVRTERGRKVLRGAIEAGYVTVRESGASQILAAQANLLGRRREIFGRLAGMRMMGMPTPSLRGFSLGRSWLRLPLLTQARSVVGTIARLIRRKGWKKRVLFGS